LPTATSSEVNGGQTTTSTPSGGRKRSQKSRVSARVLNIFQFAATSTTGHLMGAPWERSGRGAGEQEDGPRRRGGERDDRDVEGRGGRAQRILRAAGRGRALGRGHDEPAPPARLDRPR